MEEDSSSEESNNLDRLERFLEQAAQSKEHTSDWGVWKLDKRKF